ncbi:fatty acyl-AMP ligase [Actinokineospora spheciospongiae]|uniref:fatty acyl-AMP ligase n=1 Tax=Actinokineospora spheciospongiae TaxID=909613 RepID=UPI000D7155EA|nr:fatty acyl-AMP ligase [Actinokineospora spheciospongiae]PWW62739.1 acyl-CoA synthetase (AMP-forming)/AMP-acid ligase II [Actinokineospora spheciospongiae]
MTTVPAAQRTTTAVADAVALPALLRRWADRTPDLPALTFLDHDRDAEETLTWRGLDDLVDSIAAWVRPRCAPGARVAILLEQSPSYVAAFLAVLRAGRIAVPLFPPASRHDDTLVAALVDCAPELVLTTWTGLEAVAAFVAGCAPARVVPVDALPPAEGRGTGPAEPDLDDVAYLQYTSGTTRDPVGVALTHRNLHAGAAQAGACFGAGAEVAVNWLPLFHEMGLAIGLTVPLLLGKRTVLMAPKAFLHRPGRWLRALSDNPGAVTGAPSSAYAHAAERSTAAERAGLRLEHVVALVNGGESVHHHDVELFHRVFAECGLRADAHRPAYGLAEATVLVAASPAGAPVVRSFDARRLGLGEAVPAGRGRRVSTLVGCGAAVGQELSIVDPETAVPVPDGRVGEIRVRGPNVARGRWRDGGPVVDGAGWLRTGDLGVVVDGALFVLGPRTQVITAGGREHHPQDIERTVQRAHPAVRPHAVAAFGVPGPDGGRLVVVAERSRTAGAGIATRADVASAIRPAVAAAHGVRVHEVVLLEPGQVPRTSSGKIRRSASRERYLAGRAGHD